LQLGEIYDNASGVPVIYANQTQFGTSGSPKLGSNAIFDFLDWTKTAFSVGKELKFTNQVSLNDNSYPEKIKIGQQRFLTFFDLSNQIHTVLLTVYDSQGTSLYTNTLGDLTAASGIVALNIGEAFLENLGATSYLSAASYYIVNIINSADDTVFTKTIDVDNSCANYEVYRLHWLNSLGGFDAFNFTMVSTESVEIENKEYKKVQALGYQKTDRLKTKYFTKLTERITLNSDLLTDAESAALEQLVVSPVVILETSSTSYVPVNIVANNYVKRKYEQGRQIPNLQIAIEYSFDNYRQSL
jgi:hypothetical protein